MTTTTKFTTYAMEGDDAPKWRIEHSISASAGCNQAVCKRQGVKIAKGELRIGTHTWWEGEQKYIYQWRHWGCATKHQIEGLRTISSGNPEDVPGYAKLSPESQEQVRLALADGNVVDKDFKDIREDLAKFGGTLHDGEIRNAVGYKVEVAPQGRAGCRKASCKEKGIKIAKGELRLGIAQMWDADHVSWIYKHWNCISQYDLTVAKEMLEQDSLDGIDNLSDECKVVVLDSLKTGKLIEPPKPEPQPASKAKKRRASKMKRTDTGDEMDYGGAAKSERKSRKRPVYDADKELDEPASKKMCGRASKKTIDPNVDETGVRLEPPKQKDVVDPSVAKIQALVEQMRADASK